MYLSTTFIAFALIIAGCHAIPAHPVYGRFVLPGLILEGVECPDLSTRDYRATDTVLYAHMDRRGNDIASSGQNPKDSKPRSPLPPVALKNIKKLPAPTEDPDSIENAILDAFDRRLKQVQRWRRIWKECNPWINNMCRCCGDQKCTVDYLIMHVLVMHKFNIA